MSARNMRLPLDQGNGSRNRILVAGASGFAGVNLTRELVQQGCKVYAIVRNEGKLRSVLGDGYADQVHILRGDLLDSNDLENLRHQLENLADDLDVVVQTVGGGPLTSNRVLEREIFDLNYTTTSNLISILEGSKKLSALRLFVYFSSLAAMGMPNSNRSRVLYDETSSCNPILPYERAKLETETMLKNFASREKVKAVVLRFPQIYGGPDDAFLQMAKMIRKRAFPVVREKIGSLPLIHIRDVVGGTCAVIRGADLIQEDFSIYLLCEGSYSYDQIVHLVKKKYGQGGALRLPYPLLYLAVSMVEGFFGLLARPEPLNRRRLLSLTRDRVVDCRKFVNTFQFKFQEGLESFVADRLS